MIPPDWTPHRRPEDRELLGWIRPEGDGWVAVSLLGRELAAPTEWLDAEAVLEHTGLGYLAGVWCLEGAAPGPLRVRLIEVTPERITVKTEDYGAIDVPVDRFELPWPAPASLQPAPEHRSAS